MFNHSVAASIHRILLGASLSLPFAASMLSSVQAAEPEVDEIEEVTVTGSRVRGSQPVGSAVIALDRDDITSSSGVTVDRILKEIPQNFDLGVSENSRGQSGGAGNIVYSNTVNLRGIGPYATLVLIDGHRVTNNTRSTDPSVMPTLGVERIEVVADGASAIYGSDAIAGVVNVIPRRTLDGVEVFGRAGFADAGGFSETVFGGAWGKVWDRGQVMLAYEHADRDNLEGEDRDYFRANQTAFGGRDYRTTRCNPGTLRIGTTTYAMPTAGLTAANVASLAAGTSNRCDEVVGQDLFPEQQYDTVGATFTQEINDRFTVFADGFFSQRDFKRGAAFATATLTVPQTNAWFVRPVGFTGASYQIDYSFINDLPANDSIGSAMSWQLTPGVRIKLARDWQVEALLGYGKTEDDSRTFNGTNNAALTAALASTDPNAAFDPYGLGRTAASIRALVANQIFFAPTNGDFKGYELRANGTLATLAGGNLGLAAGLERQDIGAALGSARGAPGAPLVFRNFNRQVDSAYAELLIPFFGASNARPGLQQLQLNAALRYDDYSDVGDTTNAKFGLSWMPVQNLTLRASRGTSFRAPLISQIYGNSNNLFAQNYQNPAGGATIPGVALSGANLALGPEEATTWSAGFDWEPLANLRFSMTYFDVNYESQVEGYLGNLAILAREADFAGTGIILRGTAARDRVLQLLGQGITLAGGTFPGGSPNNVTLFVDGRSQNLGVSNTRGIDFQINYVLPATDIGTFNFSASGTQLRDYDVAITAAAPLIDRLNTIFNPLKTKLRLGAGWNRGPLQASLMISRVNSYQNNAVTPAEGVDSYTPVDVTFGWDLGSLGDSMLLDGLRLGLEARNALDDDPPYVNIAPGPNGSGGYDASASNPVGRLFALSLRKKW